MRSARSAARAPFSCFGRCGPEHHMLWCRIRMRQNGCQLDCSRTPETHPDRRASGRSGPRRPIRATASGQSIWATANPESNRTNRTVNRQPMGTTTQHPPRSRLPHRIMRYPPNANSPRFKRMVRPTLSTMLSAIQKRHPLPKDVRFPDRDLLFEHQIFHQGFQVKPRHGRRYTCPLPRWQKDAYNRVRFVKFEEAPAGRNPAGPCCKGLNLYASL